MNVKRLLLLVIVMVALIVLVLAGAWGNAKSVEAYQPVIDPSIGMASVDVPMSLVFLAGMPSGDCGDSWIQDGWMHAWSLQYCEYRGSELFCVYHEMGGRFIPPYWIWIGTGECKVT